MHPEPEDQLAAALHRELRQLPTHRAPANLLPRVLAKLASAERRAWWERSWFEWPRAVRRLAGAATGVMVATLVGIGLLLLNSDLLLGVAGSASHAWSVFGALGNAASLLGRAIPSSALIALGALLAASYLCAIALGTAFCRYALHRRQTI
jgi:hypothetical protein